MKDLLSISTLIVIWLAISTIAAVALAQAMKGDDDDE